MLDPFARRLAEKILEPVARFLVKIGIQADQLTLIGFFIGVLALPLLALEFWLWALGAILVNRLIDGIDGIVARMRNPEGSVRGGFLDTALDFLFYALVPFGFALADPERNALPAAWLLFSFIGTGTSFLGYAVCAEKTGRQTSARGKKAFYYLGGLTEGTETILFLVLICLLPQFFPFIAIVFGGLCMLTTMTRIRAGWSDFSKPEDKTHKTL